MKKMFPLITFCLLLIGGCQSENKKQPQAERLKFPPEIAGVWQAEGYPWQIVISQDGKVTSAIIPMGEVEVKPNQETIVEMLDGSLSVYTAGNFEAHYLPLTRQLEVTIEMIDFHIVFLDNVIDGNSTDIFTGKVSKNGKIWDTTWYNLFDYGPRFPSDPNAIEQPLRFYKK